MCWFSCTWLFVQGKIMVWKISALKFYNFYFFASRKIQWIVWVGFYFQSSNLVFSEAALQRYSQEKVFRKYAAKFHCNFIEITFRHGCFPVNLLHIFRTLFPKNTSRRLLLYFIRMAIVLVIEHNISQKQQSSDCITLDCIMYIFCISIYNCLLFCFVYY